MWFTRLAISRPILIWMALAAISVLGLQAYFRLPSELNPKVDLPILVVTTVFPGAGPPEIETQITRPLEDAVGTVGSVKDVFSSSQANVSIISLTFDGGVNIETAVADVRTRVDAIRSQLPAESRAPVVAKLDINALPVLYFGMESASLSAEALRTLADKVIRPRIERVDGVAGCQVIGGELKEIQVAVDSHNLTRYGLSIEDVVNSLKAAGRDVPAGSIVKDSRETTVRLVGSLGTLNEIRSVQIVSPALSQAAASRPPGAAPSLPAPPLTIADVASVEEGRAEQTQINRVNGRDGIGIVVTRSSDANTVAVVDGVNEALDQIKSQMPADLHRVTLRDDSVTVRDALDDVNASLVLGAVLAMFVILLFLHNIRGTFIVSLAIPACMIATFLVMYLVKFTLNQMTLLALSLSVGILVDDSIVVLESITRHIQEGEDPATAAYNGRAEIGFADITTTLVDVVVFVPIAFMSGIVGSFFKQFGLVIVVSTLFSLIVSFSVTPMLASRWYKKGENLTPDRGIFAPLERLYRALEHRYSRVLRSALHRRPLVLLLGIGALASIFVVSYYKLGTDFIPGADQGQIAVNIEMPPGASLDATVEVVKDAEKVVSGDHDVLAVVSTVGEIIGGFGSIPQDGMQFGQLTIRLKEKASLLDQIAGRASSLRRHSDEELAARFRAALALTAKQRGAEISTAAIRSVAGGSSPVEIQLRGADTAQLAAIAGKLKARLASLPGVLSPAVSVRDGKPEVRATVDRSRASERSIAAGMAGAIVRDSIAGNTDTALQRGGAAIPIRVRIAGAERRHVEDISNLSIGVDGSGSPVFLSDIATVTMETGPANIERQNGQLLVTVTSNLTAATPLSTVQSAMDRAIKETPHPGVEITWGGDAENIKDSAIPFATALIIAIVLVYFVMASLFNSMGTPFVIMFTLPMALIGALGALVLTGERMSLVSAIGIIMLIGLMGRNAILLLDFTNTLRSRGLSRTDAIVEAGAKRLRPILMTTTATMAGMLPVAMRFGRASEIRAPMAIVVIGGLMISSLLTLVVIPVLYSVFDDVTLRLRKR
jgi:hydrophobic/amphiphilic exporter-1 (mainly G- bacteria), HAE1 family